MTDEQVDATAETMAEHPPQPEPGPTPIQGGGTLQIETRGYELARLTQGGPGAGSWEPVIKYRANPLALAQARADLTWFRMRHPTEVHELRTLVSLRPPELPEPALHLEADAETTGPLDAPFPCCIAGERWAAESGGHPHDHPGDCEPVTLPPPEEWPGLDDVLTKEPDGKLDPAQ